MQKIINRPLTVIGLMSGTTFDGVDAAILKTDGEKIIKIGECLTAPYAGFFREKLRQIMRGEAKLKDLVEVEDEITLLHAKAVHNLLKQSGLSKEQIDLIAFPGQTILHEPKASKTCQLANGSLMAEETGINVITDFRRRDLAKGGEGAPLAPFYHRALSTNLEKPIVFLNIGGVANVTYIDENDEMLAFDTGPGCALIDDWVHMRLQLPYDKDGEIAKNGVYRRHKVDYLIENNPFFSKQPPKSADRNEFANAMRRISTLNTADGAATLAEFTARTIFTSTQYFPASPKKWIACGGGRRNTHLMELLRTKYNLDIGSIDNIDLGGFKVDGDFVEAQAFAFLGARCYYNKHISLPSTTGVIQPASGGAFYQA